MFLSLLRAIVLYGLAMPYSLDGELAYAAIQLVEGEWKAELAQPTNGGEVSA